VTPGAPVVIVVAAVVERDGTFLVTRRAAGVHLEGYWEFPGGKCEPEETHEECLRREMAEELDVGIVVEGRLLSVAHEYPDRTVDLHFYRCSLQGEPRAVLDQEVRWVARADLGALRFPPADEELIAALVRAG
jgi:8-oxo-dGTP diphosphatase